MYEREPDLCMGNEMKLEETGNLHLAKKDWRPSHVSWMSSQTNIAARHASAARDGIFLSYTYLTGLLSPQIRHTDCCVLGQRSPAGPF